jgi:hypothetical protein
VRGKREASQKRSGNGENSKKRSGMDAILLALGLFVLVFIVCMIVLFCVFQAVPDTLIQYTLGAGGLEALAMAGIKISKVRNGEKDDE